MHVPLIPSPLSVDSTQVRRRQREETDRADGEGERERERDSHRLLHVTLPMFRINHTKSMECTKRCFK